MEFRWIEWNWNHAQEHGVSVEDAEWLVNNPHPPYPLRSRNHVLVVWGPERGGRLIQVGYLLDEDGTAFIIHARPLTDREKRQYRRRRRR